MKINYYFSFLLLMICIIAPALSGDSKDESVGGGAAMDDHPCQCSSGTSAVNEGDDGSLLCDCSVVSSAVDELAGSEKPKLLRRKIQLAGTQGAINKDPQEDEQAEDYYDTDGGNDDDSIDLSDEDLELFHSVLSQGDHDDISQEERKLVFANLFGSGGAELSEQDRKRLFNGKFFRKISKQGKLWNFLHEQFKKHEGKTEAQNNKHWQFSMVQTPRALGAFGRQNPNNNNHGLRDSRVDAAAVSIHHSGTRHYKKDGLKPNGVIAKEE